MGRMYKFLLVSFILLLMSTASWAQCAMCRATLENNLSNGDIGPAANINIGILYLFIFPYLLIGIVAFLWYKKSKASQTS